MWERVGRIQRLAVTNAFSSAADAFVTVSLADSLFFNVSVDAARPRLLLYLVLTMAPFALIAPFIGPVVARVRGGQRTVLVITQLGRAALTLALVQDLRTLLLFPEAFGVLVLGKSYTIARTATVPRLVDDESQLVSVNARLARVSIIAGAVGGGAAVGISVFASAGVLLYIATAIFVLGGITVATVASPRVGARSPSRLEYQELHALTLSRAVQSMGVLRAGVGALTFLFAFALKRSGAPVWHFGVLFVASGIGAMTATVIADRLRTRFREQRILVGALAFPAVVAMLGALYFSIVTAAIVTAAMSVAVSSAKHNFDALAQRTAPDADLARAFAGFETRFQLAWIGGAALAVVSQANPRLGLLVLAAALGGGAVVSDIALHAAARFEHADRVAEIDTRRAPAEVLATARWLLGQGSVAAAVLVAATAVEAHRALAPTAAALDGAVAVAGERLDALRAMVMSGAPIERDDAHMAIEAATSAVERVEDGEPASSDDRPPGPGVAATSHDDG